jgi:signal transduction histidine kinase
LLKNRFVMNSTFRTPSLSSTKSIRWPPVLAISSNLLFALLIVGVGMYLFIAKAEQHNWVARQEENTRHASELIRAVVENNQNQLVWIGQLSDPSDVLQSFLQKEPFWLEIARLNARGEILVSRSIDQPVLQNKQLTHPEIWFQQAQSGKPFVGSVESSANNSPYLILAVPSVDGGVVAGRLRVSWLQNEVARLHFGETGVVYIINREDGRLVVHPTPQAVMKDVGTDETQGYIFTHWHAGSQWSGSYNNPQGIPVHADARLISGTNWAIVTEIYQSEITHTRDLALRMIGGGVVALWLLSTIATYISLDRLAFRQVEVLLNKAREKALLDSQFRSNLLAQVNHDLRQPLGVILGFSEMIRDEIFGPVNTSQRRAVSEIISSTGRLSEMVSDLLDASRLEAQNLHLRVDEFSPDLLLRQLIGQLGPQAEMKKLELITELDPRLPEKMRGDPARLLQILDSLAGNAIKFTQQGSVSIRAFQVDANHWGLSVADTGPGISADALNHIFEPFHQVNDPTNSDKGGVGLGLAIVQQLAQLMGGCIRVETTVGVGSTFLVTLPIDLNSQKENSCGSN